MNNVQDQEYFDRLVSIRKRTGLNQEQFFLKYLKDVKKGIKKDASAQDFMKKIENGKEQLTVPMLKIYAELGNCTLDELVYGESEKKNETAPEVISCADFIEMIDVLRKEGAIELELSRHDRKVYWGADQPDQELPKELPVESVSIWIENSQLSFELKEYMQIASTEKISTLNHGLSDKLLRLWLEDMKKRKNTITGTKEGHSVTDLEQDKYRFGSI